MKKSLLISALFLLLLNAKAQTHLYENPDFDQIAKNHKEIAILPFKTTVSLRPKQMKEMTEERLAKMEKDEGDGIQGAMYTWFLKRKKRGNLTVKVQNPTESNAKLKKAGVNSDNFDEYTPADLAKILEVDAIITGTFKTNKPMSEGASLALGVLVGFYGSTNKAVVNLFIHNAADGNVLINYNKSVSGSVGSTTEGLINVLMRKASRRIAYTK